MKDEVINKDEVAEEIAQKVMIVIEMFGKGMKKIHEMFAPVPKNM